MLAAYIRVMDALTHVGSGAREVATRQEGQDAFEYLLVIGGISVAVVLAMVTPVGSTAIKAVVTGTCAAIATIPNMTSVAC